MARSLRVLTTLVAAGLVLSGLAIVSSASSSGAIARGRSDRALLTHCLKVVLGLGRHSATPISGSASPQVVSHFAVLRRTRSTADRLPTATRLASSLAGAGATSYDPSAAVRLAGNGAHGALYAVPAAMALPTVPAGCNGLPQFAGVSPYLAVRAEETGSGPGACLVSTQLEQTGPSGSFLPGAKPPKPTRTLAVALVACKSEAVLEGYVGALGDTDQASGSRLALIPDGVSAIAYTLADGRGFTVPVAGNLARPPDALSLQTTHQRTTAAELGRQLAAGLPTTVTESGTSTSQTTTLTRPVSLIADYLGSFSFLRGLLTSSFGGIGSSSATSGTGASCSARNHRCVAVTVTTTCDSHERCRTTRTIHRYRYVGARPPAGTTGPDTQPTAPIVARTNRLVTHPRKLSLVLSGAPHRQVVVLMSVSCFARNSSGSGGGPALKLAVPSRTPIALPGRGFQACDVGALVLSAQRGSVRATVVRG